MLLNFKEIPQANTGSGLQDTFELFSRDFFENLGFEIIQHPDRGADGKKDLIIQESRQGITGISKIKYLVSCKHYIHSGKSVSDTDEPDINDRLRAHGCDGFIGFYSTISATSLNNKLTGSKILFEIFDRERIEKKLFDSPEGSKLASRYFPVSYQSYRQEHPTPAAIFSNNASIKCEYCEKDLLESKSGIYVLIREMKDYEEETPANLNKCTELYFSCKGEHDDIIENRYCKKHNSYGAEWEDISDLIIPTIWLTRLMAFLNRIQEDQDFDENAFNKMKYMFIKSFPYVARELTTNEQERVSILLQFGEL